MDNVAYWQEQGCTSWGYAASLYVKQSWRNQNTWTQWHREETYCGKKVVFIFITCHNQESAVFTEKTMIANLTLILYKSSNE